MFRHTLVLFLGSLVVSPAYSDTIFTNSFDTDFNNASNWTAGLGLPDTDAAAGDDDHGIISAGATADMSASYQTAVGRRFLLTVNGTLNTGSNELQLRAGSQGSAAPGSYGDLIVDGGTVNVGNGGRIDMAGVGADMFLDNGGVVNFLDGSTMQIQKAVEVIDGTLNFGAAAAIDGALQDELVIGDNGTIHFGFDGAFQFLNLSGQTLGVELGAGSTLSLGFVNAPTVGDSFELISGVSGFAGVDGGTGTGVFGSVNATGLGAGQDVVLQYNGDNLTASIVSAVPEPNSMVILGMMGVVAGFMRRRR